ncbi:hypothetical protein KEM56_000914 [Ascosphaera pollenicola]|nr:hypothetical protein KEM56_000914 [Ascosphaera pollenicola]
MESESAPLLPRLRPLSRLSASLFDGLSRRRSFQNSGNIPEDKVKSTTLLVASPNSMEAQHSAKSPSYLARPSSVYSRNIDAMSIQIYNDCRIGEEHDEDDVRTVLLENIDHAYEPEQPSSSDDSEDNHQSSSSSTMSDVCDTYDTSFYTDVTYSEKDDLGSPVNRRIIIPNTPGDAGAFSPRAPADSSDVEAGNNEGSPILPEIQPYESIMPSLKRALDSYSTTELIGETCSPEPTKIQRGLSSPNMNRHRRESTIGSTGWDRLFKEREAHIQIQPLKPRPVTKDMSTDSVVKSPKGSQGTLYTSWFNDSDVESVPERRINDKTGNELSSSARSSMFGIIPIALDSPICSPPHTILNVPSPYPVHQYPAVIPCSPQQVEIFSPSLSSLHQTTPRIQITPKVSFHENFVTNLEVGRHSPPEPVRPRSKAKHIGMKANHFSAKANQISEKASKMKHRVFRTSSNPEKGDEEENPRGRPRHVTWISSSTKKPHPEGHFFTRIIKRFSAKGNTIINDRKKSRSVTERSIARTETTGFEGFKPRPSSSGMIEEFQKKWQNRFPNLRSSSARDLSYRSPPIEIPVFTRPSTGLSMRNRAHLPQDISATWSLGITYPQPSPQPMTPSDASPSPKPSPELPARFSTAPHKSKIQRPVMPPPITIPKNSSRETCSLSSSSSGNPQPFLTPRTKLNMSPTSYNIQGPHTPSTAYIHQLQLPGRFRADSSPKASYPSTSASKDIKSSTATSGQPYSPVCAPPQDRQTPSDTSVCSPTRSMTHTLSKASICAEAGSPRRPSSEDEFATRPGNPRQSIKVRRRITSQYPRPVPPVQTSFTTSFLSWKETQFSPCERPITSPALGCKSDFPFGGNNINSNQKNRLSVFRPNDTCEEVVPPSTCSAQQKPRPPQVRLVLPGVIEGEPF